MTNSTSPSNSESSMDKQKYNSNEVSKKDAKELKDYFGLLHPDACKALLKELCNYPSTSLEEIKERNESFNEKIKETLGRNGLNQ